MHGQTCRKLIEMLRSFAGDRRGAIIVMLGILIVPLLAMVGLAIDSSRAYLAKEALGEALDAAALAGGRSFQEDYREEDVQRYFDANMPSGFAQMEVDPLYIDFQDEARTVEVIATATIPTTFMRLLQIYEIDISARALAQGVSRGLELALVLDVTGSMGWYGKLTALKTAANSLLGILYGDQDEIENLWIGVVPFAARANFSPNSGWMTSLPSPWNGCGDPRAGSLATDDSPPSAGTWPEFLGDQDDDDIYYGCPSASILPLTASKATVSAKIASLVASGNTRTDVGTVWGWRIISPSWRGLWGEADLPLDYGTENMDKAVIIMTDGENTPHLTDDPLTVAETNAQLAAECQAMKDEDIIVYTITFQAPASLDSLFTNCATDPAHYFKSPSNEDLEQVFKTIAAQLSKLRLAQ